MLFGLEGFISHCTVILNVSKTALELNIFTDESVVWRAFVTSVIAAVALQYVDPFGTSKLVLFQVNIGNKTLPLIHFHKRLLQSKRTGKPLN